MTGLDCLKNELLKKGYTKSQADSKVVLGVLEVVTGDKKYTDLENLERELIIVKSELNHKALAMQSIENRYYEMQDAIDSFHKALTECETQEQRDAIRTAQFFINSVDPRTAYDNTAYIVALGAILCGKKFDPDITLKKINKKLPVPYWERVEI